MTTVRFVGLDVHADTIAVAVAEGAGEVRQLGVIPNDLPALRTLVKRLGPIANLRCCYEAGPTGYVVYRQLTELGVACAVVAPTLVPVKPGDRVKTDRRDAVKLARSFRAGDLTPVWVPDAAHEALRDVVRAREAAKRDELRARHRLVKFLLRHNLRPATGQRVWTTKYWRWAETLRCALEAQETTRLDYMHEVEHAAARITRLNAAITTAVGQAAPELQAVMSALQALRGVAPITAVTLVTELGTLTRFMTARQLMGYAGIVAREDSSGTRTHRGAITKTGNAHVRRVVIEAAWAYRHPPRIGPTLKKRQTGLAPGICEIAWKAQHRLYRRYRHLSQAGKPQPKVVTALARELLGFIWAIAHDVDRARRTAAAA